MNHKDHVGLIKPANLSPGGAWADLGAGGGAFTLALREVIGPESVIHAVDKDRTSLTYLEREYRARFGSLEDLTVHHKDLSRPLDLPPLNGVLMANSLHFFKDQQAVLRHVASLLKPGGMLLLIEYNVDSGNPWVPHPLSFETFRALAPRAGFEEPRLLAGHPSSFLREIYSALTRNQEG